MSAFEKGDRVEVTGDVMGVQSFVFGKLGTVKDVGPVPQGPYVCVDLDGGVGWMEFFGSELTVVEKAVTAENRCPVTGGACLACGDVCGLEGDGE